ncbi:NAD(P)H-hydrate dehydratase [Salinisphaera sp. USBA-960]|nr:NAD(P)H-hydrate dehydratase [Salifodinibacter halophilus]NNC25982.1 NAD(P)H-hydrate dehydratase [Salifodinibacter halophilus]
MSGLELPTGCYDGAGVRALDQAFMAETGVTGDALMRWAGESAYRALAERWPNAYSMRVFCGGGNNAGDGYVIARLALEAGWCVDVIALKPIDELQGAARRAADAFLVAGGRVQLTLAHAGIHAEVVVDALLGTGVDRPVEGQYADAIGAINQTRSRAVGIVAVDLPSGLDAGTGSIHGDAVRADLTATFIGLKLGLMIGDGPATVGQLVFDDLGAPSAIFDLHPPIASRISATRAQTALAPRVATAHKNDHGRVHCVGGNRGMGGSIRLAAEGALRTGSGLVSVACHPDHASAMSQARPELMAAGVDADGDERDLNTAADVIVIGPGLAGDTWAERRFASAMASDKPFVLDADGLNWLACVPESSAHRRRGDWILTPHPGEAARLLACSTGDVVRDRRASVLELARRYDAVVVLKGAGTLVADSDTVMINTTGNAGMAVGGMGDVLAGIIGSLWAQGVSAFDAACVGAHIHGAAGDAAALDGGPRGLLPSDLLPYLRDAVNPSHSA